MKKIKLFLITSTLCLATQLGIGQITKHQADNLVLYQILANNIVSVDVYSKLNQQSAQEELKLYDNSSIIVPYSECWVYFIDDLPFANWNHSCRYLFVNSTNGNYSIIESKKHPANWKTDFTLLSCVESPASIINLLPNPDAVVNSLPPDPHKYAVIINGMDFDRYWNDCSAIYSTLIQVYGFTKENIFVHYDLGFSDQHPYYNDFDDDGIPDIDYNAHKTTIRNTFQELAGESNNNPNIPELGIDDQLFVYVTDHGGFENGNSYIVLCSGDNSEKLYDYELASYVENIKCAQMIFLMAQCNSGGFVDDIMDFTNYDVKCKNRAIHTAAQETETSMGEIHITNTKHDEFVFYWVAAARGHYPVINQPWLPSIYSVGTFPFHTIPRFANHPGDYNPDTNADGYIQMEEAFEYANFMDTWSPNGYFNPFYSYASGAEIENPINQNDIGINVDLLTLSGYAGIIDTIAVLESRSYVMGGNIAVLSNASLTLPDSNVFYFGNNSNNLIICENGNLNIHNNVKLFGSYSGSIIVNGTIDIGNNVIFTNTALNIHSTTFAISNCQFIETELYANCGAESTSSTVSVVNCSFYNIEKNGITITNYGNYLIEYDTITGVNGLQIVNSGLGINNRIMNNQILNCSDVGVIFYNATGTLQNNYIHNNKYGLKLLNLCNVAVVGNVSSSVSFQTQRIKNNQQFQIYSSENAFPWYFKFNVISVDNQTHTTPYLYYGDDEIDIAITNLKDVTYNCWGANFNPATHLFPPNQFYYLPTWCPSGTTDTLGGNDEDLFDLAMQAFETGKYGNAKTLFEQIIVDFPTSHFAQVAMKELFRVESFINNNYNYLQNYYLNNSNIQSDTILANLANILVNQCDIKMQNYADAIAWYENKILNPTCLEDSVFAIIDLGYLYLLMENNNSKNSYTGSLVIFKPKNETQYKAQRKKLWDLLPAKRTEKNSSHFTNSLIAKLFQNVPNPTNNSTLIKYELFEKGTVTIVIKDNLGKTVMQIEQGKREKGLHETNISVVALKSGIYYYSLLIDGQSVEVKKMVIVK